MKIWTPPKGSKIVFEIGRLTGVPSDVLRKGNADKWAEVPRRAFCKEFNRKFERYRHDTIPLSDPRWPEMLDWIEDLTKRGEGGVGRGSGNGLGIWWMEAPKPKPTDRTAWFPLCTGRNEIRSPNRSPNARHFVRREPGRNTWGFVLLASAEFKNAVDTAGLTGLAFLPLADWDGWWQVWATQPLGRGLDHPLVDPEKLVARADPDQPILEPRRRGEPCAWIRYLREDAQITSPTIARLVALGDDQWCRIAGPHRVVREHLPQTDFAYSQWTCEEDHPPDWVGRRFRDICCNHRAREVLIDAGVMKPSHFTTPILTIPETDADTEVLDRTIRHPLPLPVFTAEEAAAEAKRRASIRSAPTPKRTTPPKSAAALLATLNARIDDGSPPWTPLRDHARQHKKFRGSRFFVSLPDALKQLTDVLPVELEVPGDDEDEEPEFELELSPPHHPTWLEQDAPHDDPEHPSPHDIVFAQTGCGDWFAIRSTDPAMPTDAKVTWWDHETFTPRDQWPDVATFIAYLLEIADRTQ